MQHNAPYRGTFGDPRPAELAGFALPPAPMPCRDGSRPLKAWRYVGVYGAELMLCVGAVRIGRARQAFWAVWDRAEQRLYERTVIGRGRVRLEPGSVRVREQDVQIDLSLEEVAGVETVCPSADSYAWTRKQGGIRVRGAVALGGRAARDRRPRGDRRHRRLLRPAHQLALVGGVGIARDGTDVAWNLVSGVNDPQRWSERTVWVDGEPVEAAPSAFAGDLSGVDGLRFDAEAVRESHDNLLVIRSSYRQPFGTFSGTLPDGVHLAAGYGVMEEHDAYW